MDIILITCIILFITYVCIIGILLYHFIYKRDIWDKTFYPILESEISSSILNSFLGLSNELEHKDNDIYQIRILTDLYSLLTPLEDLPELDKMFLILKYIIRNYNICKDAKIELLDALLGIKISHTRQTSHTSHIGCINSKKEVKNIDKQVLDHKFKLGQELELELELEDILVIETHYQNIKKLMNLLLNLDINKISSYFLLSFMIQLQKTIIAIMKIHLKSQS